MQISLRRYGALLGTYLRPLLPQVALLGLLLAGSTALQLAGPQVLRAFIDAATNGATTTHLQGVAGLYVGLAVAQQALAVLATYYGERVGWASTNALREDLLLHCLRLDLSFHKARTPGELIERIDGDVTAMANFFSQFIVQIVGNVVLLLGVIVMLWRVDWRAGLSLAVFAVVTFTVMHRMRGITVPYWRRARQASADLFGFIEERLGGTEDIRTSGAEAYVLRRFHLPLRERVLTNCRARVIGALQWTTPNLLASIQVAVSFVLTYVLYRQGMITIGTGVMINSYTWLSFRPLRVISNQMEDLQKAGAGIVRVDDLLRETSALHDPVSPVAIPEGPLSVEFDGVTFGYDEGPFGYAQGRPRTKDESPSYAPDSSFVPSAGSGQALRPSSEPVLVDIAFRLAPGTVLGLLGRTGSGKTTISRLLFRLYDPSAGAVRLGGVDLRAARRGDLRARIGMVTQDVQLFRATVRDNVTFFDASIPDARIVAAMEDLGLGDWYRHLPDGLETMLGAGGGAGVSAGQAQLLAFTRVFLKDPGLVLLDEASSRLDPATERLIGQAVERLLQARTGIIIAHRLSTIQRADEVMILERGYIAEYGPRVALAADPHSRFAALLRTSLEHQQAPALAEVMA